MTYADPAVSYERQRDILDPDKAADTYISVLGCGTVGSWAATCLAKAGFKKFFLCDMDVVEDVNLPSQAFRMDDLGANKAEALQRELEGLHSDYEHLVQTEPLEGYEQHRPGVILSAVDNMELRKDIFTYGAKGLRDSLFIDFRMGGNLLKVWAFDPSDERRSEQYMATLHTSDEASPLPCGGRTFAPIGPLAGAIGTQLVTKWLRDGDNPPFHIQMDFDRFASRAIGLPTIEDAS